MHLADHDEALVNSRIWTEAEHIEQRLADLTAHMEIVLQKYLRNQFRTLAEYNLQAGEVAEPFRFLVAADFPVNFSADACRRLISLAAAGARCGIYVFVMIDTNQPLPQGVDSSDLERACLSSWRKRLSCSGATVKCTRQVPWGSRTKPAASTRCSSNGVRLPSG